MKLNKQQQQQWNALANIFTALSRVSPSEEALVQEMSTWICDFEQALGHEVKVKIRMAPAPSIDLVDCSRDSMRLHRDAEGTLTLRARIEDISIQAVVARTNAYAHSNGAVVDALRSLADSLETSPVELRSQTATVDIYSLLGMSRSGASADDEENTSDFKDASTTTEADEGETLIQLEPCQDDETKSN
jgi:hypothetical protein